MLDPQAIKKNYLVYGLTEDQLRSMSKLASTRDVAPGEVLCREGDRADEVFIVAEGRFAVRVGGGDQLAEIGAGSVVGEMGLIDPRPRSATVEAIDAAKVIAIPTADLRQELVTDGNLGFVVLCNIARLLSERLRNADAKLATLMGG